MRHPDEIDLHIETWTSQLPNTEVEHRLKANGVPAESMRRARNLLDVPDGTQVFKRMDEPPIGSMLTTWLPFSLSWSSLSPPHMAPGLGENTREVLHEWLDLADEEIDELESQGVLV